MKLPSWIVETPQRSRIIIGAVFTVLVVLAVLLIIQAMSTSESVPVEYVEEEPIKVEDTPKVESESEDSTSIVLTQSEMEIEYPHYYEERLADRYEAYSALHPEIPLDDIYWMVGCDLDYAPYENTQVVSDPNSMLVLVNKHYSLPLDYEPTDLVMVSNALMRQEAATMMQEMINGAAADGITLWTRSGYRSSARQSELYTHYTNTSGQEAADTFSARPGFSEHQTGLTADITSLSESFAYTPEGIWLAENCWKYGYIVHYTNENSHITLYQSEPWHVRYIGVEAAQTILEKNLSSFDEYWVKYVKYLPE